MNSHPSNLFGIPIAIDLVTPCSALLALLVFGVPWRLGLKHWKWFKSKFNAYGHNKYLWRLHGAFVFGLMWSSQPRNLEMLFGGSNPELLAIVQFGMVSLLAIILWDFGYMDTDNSWTTWIQINCHHVGLFLAILFGPGWHVDSLVDNGGDFDLLQRQIRLDVFIYAWLWLIHSLGFLLEVVLPRVFGHLDEGARSGPYSFIQHAYALGSVYLFHQYANSNLAKLFTYQMTSLLVMLFGRHFINHNWRHVDWMRRIEFPGFLVVMADRILGFHDTFCQRSLAILAGLGGISLLYAVFLADRTPRPKEYFAPEDHPKLRKFLAEEIDKVRGISATEDEFQAAKAKWDKMQSVVKAWMEEKKTKDGTPWTQKYPVHTAIASFEPRNPNHTEQFVNLLDKLGKKALDQPLLEWHDEHPIEWSAAFQYSYECTLILLQRGAQPYWKGDNAVNTGMRDHWKSSATGKKGALGFSDGFWERFNELCVQKSPSKVLTLKERLFEILKSF